MFGRLNSINWSRVVSTSQIEMLWRHPLTNITVSSALNTSTHKHHEDFVWARVPNWF